MLTALFNEPDDALAQVTNQYSPGIRTTLEIPVKVSVATVRQEPVYEDVPPYTNVEGKQLPSSLYIARPTADEPEAVTAQPSPPIV